MILDSEKGLASLAWPALHGRFSQAVASQFASILNQGITYCLYCFLEVPVSLIVIHNHFSEFALNVIFHGDRHIYENIKPMQ